MISVVILKLPGFIGAGFPKPLEKWPWSFVPEAVLPQFAGEDRADADRRAGDTGDIARQGDDGYIYLLDRRNDMIISGGMNVYTRAVEDTIRPCPGVCQAAVVGLSHLWTGARPDRTAAVRHAA
jgi:acyl-CoA synthetase (AMP-forming)/AMP-acid ligase II